MSDGHVKFQKRRSIRVDVIPDEVDPKYLDKTLKKKLRFIMLLLACTFVISNYFCYDNPAAVQEGLEDEFTAFEYSLLYVFYAVPNVFLPLTSGIILDKLGHRNGLIIFTVILCLGQGIFMYGGYQKSFAAMAIGRGLFGIGCESMYVGQSAIITEWFINYELGFAIAMISCVPLCGSFLNGALLPSIFLKSGNNFGVAFSVGFYLCLFSLFLVLIIALIDFTAEKHDQAALEDFKR